MRNLGIAATVVVAACSSAPHPSPAPQQRDVRIVGEQQRDAMKQCTPLGIVESAYGVGENILADGPVDNTVRRRLREDAATRGANVVLINYGRVGANYDRTVRGEAFSCSRRPELDDRLLRPELIARRSVRRGRASAARSAVPDRRGVPRAGEQRPSPSRRGHA